ncbi:hypothetical protein [Nonomuraea rhizosphaerae]|uniref:hypothetical protein n=1 Tax=Nonomuraea rhizosphaerae TaxID=2665663 RepID=UPI001C5CF1BA|nr:hypothetical protein [Nonomuraea rhizosphaerae]
MSLSDVIRNITKTVTNKDELKEKAKDLPLLVIQTTLSAAGQALLLVDRVKNSIRGLGGKEDKEADYDSRPAAAAQVATPVPVEETDKPARKEPVIFAPRTSPADAGATNGAAKSKPDPVIFSPAKPKPEAKTADPVTEAKSGAPESTITEPKPAAEPVAAPEPAPAPEPSAAAEPVAPAKPVDIAEAVTAPEPVVAPEPVAAPEPVVARATDLTEPLAGYSGLTVASLRARMRGKSAEQITDLLAYEQATTGRPEVIKMFENRLAKLRAEG